MRHINAPAVFMVPVVLSGCGGDRAPRLEPSGNSTTTGTQALKTGSKVLQTDARVSGMTLPFGDAHLEWSFNREGEARLGLVEERDRRMDMDTNQIREQRQDLVEMARPQFGMDALKGKFGRKTREIPGVKGVAGTRATSRTGTP
jgi:hypothetical protein